LLEQIFVQTETVYGLELLQSLSQAKGTPAIGEPITQSGL